MKNNDVLERFLEANGAREKMEKEIDEISKILDQKYLEETAKLFDEFIKKSEESRKEERKTLIDKIMSRYEFRDENQRKYYLGRFNRMSLNQLRDQDYFLGYSIIKL